MKLWKGSEARSSIHSLNLRGGAQELSEQGSPKILWISMPIYVSRRVSLEELLWVWMESDLRLTLLEFLLGISLLPLAF